jgi:ankyrin repeat protein
LTNAVLETGVYGGRPNSDKYSPFQPLEKLETALGYPGALESLYAAIAQDDTERVQRVLSAGVWLRALDPVGRTPLMLAAAGGNNGIVHLLIGYGFDINYNTPRGDNALQTALSKSHYETAALLVAEGADWKSLQPFYANRLAMGLYRLSYDGSVDGVRQLLDAGVDPDVSGDSSGITPVMAAAKKGQIDVMRLLIDRGANVNTRASHNRYALRMAESNRDQAMIELLVQNGAVHPK